MMKCFLAFISGAVTVTGFVVATGARTGGLVALGFVAATIFFGLFVRIIGHRRLVRLLSWIFREPEHPTPRRVSRRSTAAGQSKVELEVVSALVHQGATRNAAVKATADAASQTPQEFEPLFRAAVGMLHVN